MTETFLFVRLGEGEVYRNVVWKLQKCHDRVGNASVLTATVENKTTSVTTHLKKLTTGLNSVFIVSVIV